MTEPTQGKTQVHAVAWAFIAFTMGAAFSGCGTTTPAESTLPAATAPPQATESSAVQVAEGQRVFRFETSEVALIITDTVAPAVLPDASNM